MSVTVLYLGGGVFFGTRCMFVGLLAVRDVIKEQIIIIIKLTNFTKSDRWFTIVKSKSNRNETEFTE